MKGDRNVRKNYSFHFGWYLAFNLGGGYCYNSCTNWDFVLIIYEHEQADCQRLITTMLDEVTPWSNSRAQRYQRLCLSTRVCEAMREAKSTCEVRLSLRQDVVKGVLTSEKLGTLIDLKLLIYCLQDDYILNHI
jgi:hypothetical protein